MRAGDRRKTYDAERLDDISSRRQPDRFVLQMMATMILVMVVVMMVVVMLVVVVVMIVVATIRSQGSH